MNEALLAYTRVLFLESNDGLVYLPATYNAGIINFELKCYQISLSYFKQVVNSKHSDQSCDLVVHSCVNIGIVSLKLKYDINQAIRSFEHALSLNSQCSPALINLAHVYIMMNAEDSRERGKFYYRKVLEIEPLNEEAISYLNQ